MLEMTFLWINGVVNLVALGLSLCNKHDFNLIVGRFWIVKKPLNLSPLIMLLIYLLL
jgi:hypothetical protein